MRVPVLVIRADNMGLVMVNGHWAGETGPECPLTMPVSPGGTHSLFFQPYGAAAGVAARLCFRGGKLEDDPEGLRAVRVSARAGGAWEIWLRSEQEKPKRLPMPRTLQRVESGERTVSLMEWDGLCVTVEDAGSVLAHHMAEGLSSAVLQQRQGLAVQLLAECEVGQRLMVFSAVNGDVMLDITGDTISAPIDQPDVLATRALPDVACHTVETHMTCDARGVWRGENRVRPTGEALKQPQTPEDTALALCQAVALGEAREAVSYLTVNLRREIENGRLNAYMGQFDACMPAGSSGDEVLVEVLDRQSPRFTQSRLYAMRVMHAPDMFGEYKVDDIRLVE